MDCVVLLIIPTAGCGWFRLAGASMVVEDERACETLRILFVPQIPVSRNAKERGRQVPQRVAQYRILCRRVIVHLVTHITEVRQRRTGDVRPGEHEVTQLHMRRSVRFTAHL